MVVTEQGAQVMGVSRVLLAEEAAKTLQAAIDVFLTYFSLRDGNTIAIPEASRPPGYRPPGFRVEAAPPDERVAARAEGAEE
jgi:hypothetical protein